MSFPQQIIKRDSIDPKLAVGSSLPNPKGLFSIVLVLYLVNDEKDYLDFSIKNGKGINLKPRFIPMLKSFFSGINGYQESEIESLQTINPLLEMQIEPLQVALQLFWKIAKINIVGTDSSSAERTGGIRFPKELFFTTNIDIVKFSISDENDIISNFGKELIYSWLFNKAIHPSLQNIELKLIKTLTIFSEGTLFKTWDNTTEIIFQQEGIYQAFDANNPKINIKGTKEIKGTLRNLKSAIDKNLHPFLVTNGDDVELKNFTKPNIFSYYKNKVSNYLDLSPKYIEIKTIDGIDEVNLVEYLADNQEVIFNKSLKGIIFESFKYLKSIIDEGIVLSNYEIKDSKIEGRSYKGLTLPKYFNFEVFIGLFNDEQTINNLKSSGTSRFIDEKIKTFDFENSYFTSQWNGSNNRGLSLGNFNNFLKDVSNNTLKIIKENEVFKLIKKNRLEENAQNKIFYGAPGTGKSYKVDNLIKDLESQYFERLTFHPEFDNASFVGGYKPISVQGSDGADIIKYKFVPQAFTNIYKRAWFDLKNQYFLVLEEINRGNCAEIFGEIFQLLDRNSNYSVSPSKELKDFLVSEEGFNDSTHEGIINGLKLPSNLSILATMNTSDQSLFPMDSAFKRRWEWEYVPICYTQIDDEGKPNSSFDFIIDIQNGKKYSWINFIEQINLNHIKMNPYLGMDKCVGNYFIKPDNELTISLKQFINKVIFYLWNDVFKDEENKVFEENTSYEDFFPIETKGKSKIEELLNRIGLKPIAKDYSSVNEIQITQISAEGTSEYENPN